MQRLIPYGMTNFETIIKENYYFIDKTKYIEEIEKLTTPVFLRPRRFGKSLFTEMLKWYYDIKAKDRFQELFSHLYIGKNPTKKQGSYYFLTLDFSGINASSSNILVAEQKFNDRIVSLLSAFLRHYKKDFSFNEDKIIDFMKMFSDNASKALQYIVDLVNGINKKIFIVIDEYDSLTNGLATVYNDQKNTEYYKVLDKGGFFRSFFETLKYSLKISVEKIYITGILPITISDMNSGFNVAEWISHDKIFDNMLGITTLEMDKLLDEILSDYPDIKVTKEQIFEKLRIYANNYKFNLDSESVFNTTITMSILKHIISLKNFPEDFVDSNIRVSYNQIAYIFGDNYQQRDEVIKELTDTKTLLFQIEKKKLFDLKDYKSGNYIKDCLYYHGLITNSEYPNEFVIPNLVTYEMLLTYFERIMDFELNKSERKDFLMKFLQTGDLDFLVDEFFTRIIQKFPGDFFKNVNESFYHGLFFHLLYNSMSKDRYEVLPEYNLPNGAVDVMFKTLPGAKVRAEFEVLMEIKRVPKGASEKEFEAKFKEAIDQVNSYKTGDYKDFTALAICFRGNKDYKIDY